MNVAENLVRYALAIGALELVPEGRKLKSGRVSPYFFNSGLFNTGEALSELAEAYDFTEKIPWSTDIIFGPAYKGIPLAATVATAIWKKHGVKICFAFNRKEAKGHGEKGIIVGHPLVGKRVCIVDDVMTTGTSSGEAVDIIRANGGIPIACAIAFDRQERGNNTELSAVQEFEHNYDIPVYSATTLADLIFVLEKDAESNSPTIPNSKEFLRKILAYQNEYGIK